MKKDYIYSDQQSLFGGKGVAIGFGDSNYFIKEIDRKLANKTIIKNNYSHKIYNATYIHLGVYLDNKFVGVLQYGYAMNPASQESVVKNTKIDEYLELNRMWIDDKAGKNSESKAISYSIKFIKRKYPKIRWVQSFADERCKFFGIVYQACSFGFYGEHTSKFYELDGVVYHKSLMERNPMLSKAADYLQANKDRANSSEFRQFRYIKFIKNCKKDCVLKEQKYLKYYNGD